MGASLNNTFDCFFIFSFEAVLNYEQSIFLSMVSFFQIELSLSQMLSDSSNFFYTKGSQQFILFCILRSSESKQDYIFVFLLIRLYYSLCQLQKQPTEKSNIAKKHLQILLINKQINTENSFTNISQFLLTLIKLIQSILFYMLSDLISSNSHGAINPQRPQQRTQAFQIIQSQAVRYRVLSREYKDKESVVSFWCVFWLVITIVSAAVLITSIQSVNLVFFSGILSALILFVYTVYSCKKIEKIFAYSNINISISLAATSVLLILDVKMITIPVGIMVLIQLILSAILIKQKGKIILQIFILAQIQLLAIKYDDFIKISWNQALIPLLIVFIFLAASFVAILAYNILLNIYYKQAFKVKKYSIFFLLFNQISLALGLGMILGYTFLSISPILLSILSMAAASTNFIYLWTYSRQISLNFCVHKQEVRQGDKDVKIQLRPISKTNKKKKLYRLSQNWFSTQAKQVQQSFNQMKYPQCLVCVTNKSDIIWLPCGHLSLCSGCCKDMIENSMISCVLCKQKPTHICRLEQKDQKQDKMDRLMGIVKNRQDNIIQDYEVRNC